MGIVNLFIGFKGRIGRLGFWAGLIALFLISSAATYKVLMLMTSGDISAAFAQLTSELTMMQKITYLALALPLTALIVKRLHDRNKSGFWLALIWVPALIKLGQPMIIDYLGDGTMIKMGLGVVTKFLTAEMAAVGFWFLIELGFMGGKDDGNRFNGATLEA